jgi:hypothetical protein
MALATEVATSQPFQSDPKPLSGAPNKTWLPLRQQQVSHKLNSASQVTTSSLQKSAPLSGQIRQDDPSCEPVIQSTKAAPSPRKISKPASTFMDAASQTEPRAESPKKLPQSEPPRKLLDAKGVKDQYVAPKAPRKIAPQPSSSGKATVANRQPQPAPNPTVIAPEAKPRPTRKATPQAPKSKSKPVSAPKPAVQTHAGLYSGFIPSVAAVDQPTPKTLSNAQKTASNVLYRAKPSYPRVTNMGRQYTRQDDYNAARDTLFASSTASPRPLGTVRTGGPLGGGQHSSTGGAFGGEKIAQTGGRFGEATVSKTGGSLGEAFGEQGYESGVFFKEYLDEEHDKKMEERTRKILQEYFPGSPLALSLETSKATPGYGSGGVGGSRI